MITRIRICAIQERENAQTGAWGMSVVPSERHKGKAPADFMRFYFMNDADPEAFNDGPNHEASSPCRCAP